MDGDQIADPSEVNYQIGKPLDIWSGALWLGAALKALAERASDGDETARVWVDRVPGQVKARWPGVFPESPPCPRCGKPMEQIASPEDRWDDASWVWGCDCEPT